jgi:tRNA(adenine34) deaminase
MTDRHDARSHDACHHDACRHDARNHDACECRAPPCPSRRRVITALAASTALSAAPALAGNDATADDLRFMRLALDEARQGDFPFGAVIVRNGEILARGRNLGRTNGDPTAHGEMMAIRHCIADHGREAFHGSTIYTTGEPCPMCMGAILWCRIDRLVFAASMEQLATKINQIMMTSADVAAKTPFTSIAITGGVLADEAMQLFGK